MEKLVFLFRRKPGMTREAYFDHYLNVHAPLGLRHQPGLSGYTVNLVKSEVDYDAVTEIWTPSAAEFTGGQGAMTEGTRAISADHQSFMGPMDSFAVDERIVRDGALTSPLGEESPGIKLISLYGVGESVPKPADGAHRVVDNVVTAVIYLKDRSMGRRAPVAGDTAIIRTTWFDAAHATQSLPAGSARLREFRNRLVA